MSNLFNYEIDERNLRVQLKNIELPFREETWEKFEHYTLSHQINEPRPSWRRLELGLNRNVLLPAIFGFIIILFSFMLYSFVTIEDSTNAQASQTEEISDEQIVVEAEPVTENVSSVTSTKDQVISEQKAPELVAAPVSLQDASTVQRAAEIEIRPDTAIAINTVQLEIQKKRNRRQQEDATISAIKPTVVAEEEPEVEIPQ